MMGIVTILIIIIIVAICAGIFASKFNRNVFGWVILCLLFPLAIIILLCLGKLKANTPEQKCPFCAETISAEALVCKHCGRDIKVQELTQ